MFWYSNFFLYLTVLYFTTFCYYLTWYIFLKLSTKKVAIITTEYVFKYNLRREDYPALSFFSHKMIYCTECSVISIIYQYIALLSETISLTTRYCVCPQSKLFCGYNAKMIMVVPLNKLLRIFLILQRRFSAHKTESLTFSYRSFFSIACIHETIILTAICHNIVHILLNKV